MNGQTKPKIYVVTSAQAVQSERHATRYGNDWSRGAPNKELIRGLDRYCKYRGAELIIIGMAGMDNSEEELSSYFDGRDDVYIPHNKRLNSNVELSDMVVPPQNVDPVAGRSRFAQRESTKIFAHPKQRWKAVPASNSKLPKLMLTTGAVTHPNYHPKNHRGDAAKGDHTYGAVVIEIVDDVSYNVRHIRAQANGKFVDLGYRFGTKGKPTRARTEALVLGDLHVGDHDEKTMRANYEMIDYFKPERLFIHDFFNGHSVNPHEREQLVTRAQNYQKGRLDLENELRICYNELCSLSKAMGKKEVNIVASNHPFFLDRYLESGEFTREPWNMQLALRLGSAMVENKDPVEEGIKLMGDIPRNVRFLKLGDDYKVWGWQLASHGHKGTSGARGNVHSRELAHGKSITGHTHTPEVLRNTVIVGTSTKLNLEYTEGESSSWMAANAVLYDGGLVQLLPIINGKWKLKSY